MTLGDNQIICPADGKVVVIEEVTEVEYFKDKRIQVSIFMSPANVHVNRNPMSAMWYIINTIKENTWWHGIRNHLLKMKDGAWLHATVMERSYTNR
jgi:hypothetical protein